MRDPRIPSDPLDAARGCLYGLFLSAPVIFFILWILT